MIIDKCLVSRNVSGLYIYILMMPSGKKGRTFFLQFVFVALSCLHPNATKRHTLEGSFSLRVGQSCLGKNILRKILGMICAQKILLLLVDGVW